MIHGIWELFVTLLSREEQEEEGTNRFVPSPLDLSVRVGHGGRDDEVERELSKIRDQARELEAHQGEN